VPQPAKSTFLSVLFMTSVVVPISTDVLAAEVAPKSEAVLAQNLAGNILWTRRPDRFTLQVLTDFRPIPGTKGAASKPAAAPGRELPSIEVWLLRKEGAAIPPIQR